MTVTFLIKQADNGELLVEVSPNHFKDPEPVINEMRYTCMPGASRRKHRDESGPKFSM